MRSRKLIVVLTIFYGLTLGVTYFSLERIRMDQHLNYELVDEDPDRNEESTPRSFVLPATPAVAFAQEKKSSTDVERASIVSRCIVALRALGYDIVREGEKFNVPLVKAILSIQRKAILKETGMLDSETMIYLKCSNVQ